MAAPSPRTTRCGAAEVVGSRLYTLTVLPRVTETNTLPPAAAMETRLSSELLAALTDGIVHWPS